MMRLATARSDRRLFCLFLATAAVALTVPACLDNHYCELPTIPDTVAAVEDIDARSPFADPYDDGPVEYRVSTRAFARAPDDPMADRPVETDLYLPEGDGPFPTVIVSPGYLLSKEQYASYGRRLASHGVLTVVVTFGDTLATARTHSALAEDLSTLLDALTVAGRTPGDELEGRVDVARVGLAGHSRGGKLSLLAAVRDTRVAAVLGFDPVDSAPPDGAVEGGATPEDYPSVAPELMSELSIPTGYIGSGRSADTSLGQACAPVEDNWHAYFDEAPAPAYAWHLPTAGHFDFLDDAEGCGLLCAVCLSGDIPDTVKAFASATLVAFFKVHLAGDADYADWLTGPPVTARAGFVELLTR